MNYILFVTNPENFKLSTTKNIVGFKQMRRNFADKSGPGDQIAFYIAGVGKIGGIVRLESDMYEDREKIFTMKTSEEIYPWRFKSSVIIKLPEEKWISIEEFRDKLEIFKKRTGPHWKLALQGQIHYISPEDFQIIEESIKKAA